MLDVTKCLYYIKQTLNSLTYLLCALQYCLLQIFMFENFLIIFKLNYKLQDKIIEKLIYSCKMIKMHKKQLCKAYVHEKGIKIS